MPVLVNTCPRVAVRARWFPHPVTDCLCVCAQCSASCGEGVQQRQVVCKGSENSGRCEGDKPEAVQGCHVAVCPGERRSRRGWCLRGACAGRDQPSCFPPARLSFRGMPAKKVGLNIPDAAGRERVEGQPKYCYFAVLGCDICCRWCWVFWQFRDVIS